MDIRDYQTYLSTTRVLSGTQREILQQIKDHKNDQRIFLVFLQQIIYIAIEQKVFTDTFNTSALLTNGPSQPPIEVNLHGLSLQEALKQQKQSEETPYDPNKILEID